MLLTKETTKVHNSVFDELLNQSKQLEKTASQVQKDKSIGLTAEQIDQLIEQYQLCSLSL